MSIMSELDMNRQQIEVLEEKLSATMAVRDLLSATQSLSEIASCKSTEWLVKVEANDIELAYVRLGRMLSRIRMEQTHAA